MKRILCIKIGLLFICSFGEAFEVGNKDFEEVVQLRINSVKDADSSNASKLVYDFYNWYAKALHAHEKSLTPDFVRDSNGMSTLYMNDYLNMMRSKKFSNKLMNKTIARYKICLDNLHKINYDTLLANYELSEMEDIHCAFSNVHEWISEMEPHDGADIESVSKRESDIIVKVLLYSLSDGKKVYWMHKYINVSVVKDKDQWVIDNIDVVYTNPSRGK